MAPLVADKLARDLVRFTRLPRDLDTPQSDAVKDPTTAFWSDVPLGRVAQTVSDIFRSSVSAGKAAGLSRGGHKVPDIPAIGTDDAPQSDQYHPPSPGTAPHDIDLYGGYKKLPKLEGVIPSYTYDDGKITPDVPYNPNGNGIGKREANPLNLYHEKPEMQFLIWFIVFALLVTFVGGMAVSYYSGSPGCQKRCKRVSGAVGGRLRDAIHTAGAPFRAIFTFFITRRCGLRNIKRDSVDEGGVSSHNHYVSGDHVPVMSGALPSAKGKEPASNIFPPHAPEFSYGLTMPSHERLGGQFPAMPFPQEGSTTAYSGPATDTDTGEASHMHPH